MDEPVLAGDVLGQPTRARLFALLTELKRQASTQELAEALGLHVNGVRQHLERLQRAGLVERHRARYGRGRPRDQWSVSAEAKPGGERPRAYSDLAGWLARVIPPTPGRLREVEQIGREIGGELVPSDAARTPQGFEQLLSSLGFQPDLTIEDDGSLRCELCNCPYRDSVRENQAAVCTLHRGITAGILAELAPGASLTKFEPHDPERAGCVVEAAGTEWSEK
jgi:predicted ArsR family transcriptional regulator